MKRGPFGGRDDHVPHGKAPPGGDRTSMKACKWGHPVVGNSIWMETEEGLRRKCAVCERERVARKKAAG